MKNPRWIHLAVAVLVLFGGAIAVFYSVRNDRQTSVNRVADKVDDVGLSDLSSREVKAVQPDEGASQPKPLKEWHTYHGDNTLRGVAACSLPEKLDIVWRLKTGDPVRQPPAVHEDRIFFATVRGEIISANLSGDRLWSKELFSEETKDGEPVRARIEAPVTYFDGRILVGTEYGVLCALDAATGEERWRADLDGMILGAPNYLEPSRVYAIEQGNGALYCLDAQSGQELWNTEGVERCDSPPAVSANTVVFGSCAAALHVFSPETGELQRNIEIDGDSQVAGGVALDGDQVVSGCRSGKIFEVDLKTGAFLWTNTVSEAEVFATPAITTDWVVVGSEDGHVYGLDRKTGALRWCFDTDGLPSSPVIADDKVVVAADGELFLLGLSDGEKLWSFKVGEEISSPAVIERMILVGSEDGTVVAFDPVQ